MSDENKGADLQKAQESKEKKASVTLKDVVDGYARTSKENKGKNKENVKVSLTERHEIEFIEDFGEFKKGDSASVSEIAKDYYLKNKVAKELK